MVTHKNEKQTPHMFALSVIIAFAYCIGNHVLEHKCKQQTLVPVMWKHCEKPTGVLKNLIVDISHHEAASVYFPPRSIAFSVCFRMELVLSLLSVNCFKLPITDSISSSSVCKDVLYLMR